MKKRVDGINNNTYNLLFEDYDNLKEKEQGNYEFACAFATIDWYTKIQEKKIFMKLLKLVFKNTIVQLDKITFNEHTQQFEYKDNDITFTFDKMANCFENEKIKKELTSNKRYGECHTRAMSISPSIEGSKIVTGYATILDQKFLHSVIEYEYNGETIILDWTRNLKMTKEQYIQLTKFQELASFEGRKVVDDIEIIFGNIDIGVKPYIIFRNELVKDIMKNPHIFKPSEKGLKVTQKFKEAEEKEKQLTKH